MCTSCMLLRCGFAFEVGNDTIRFMYLWSAEATALGHVLIFVGEHSYDYNDESLK